MVVPLVDTLQPKGCTEHCLSISGGMVCSEMCKSCLMCAGYHRCGHRTKPPLQSIPVGAPFDRVGVDIMEMPRTLYGNQYVVVFVEYLTKWIVAYAAEDQTSETLARLVVDCVVCRHEVPGQLLSEQGPNLLSNVLLDVCQLLGVKKVNTTSYHPQTDGLVERMNQTIQSMLAKHVHTYGPDWDLHLQQVLFAYCVKPKTLLGSPPSTCVKVGMLGYPQRRRSHNH